MNVEQLQDEILEQNASGQDEGFDAGYRAGHKAAMQNIFTSLQVALEWLSEEFEEDDHADYVVKKLLTPLHNRIHKEAVSNKAKVKGQTAAKKAFMMEH